MLRKLAGLVTLVIMGLVMLPGLASADQPPYPAPPVTPTTGSVDPVPYTPTSSGTALAETGAGFDAGLVALAAGIVVALGVAMILVGHKLRKSPAGR